MGKGIATAAEQLNSVLCERSRMGRQACRTLCTGRTGLLGWSGEER